MKHNIVFTKVGKYNHHAVKNLLMKLTSLQLVRELRRRIKEEKKILGLHIEGKKHRLENELEDVDNQLDQLDDIKTDLECL